jgi:hypothetical protein
VLEGGGDRGFRRTPCAQELEGRIPDLVHEVLDLGGALRSSNVTAKPARCMRRECSRRVSAARDAQARCPAQDRSGTMQRRETQTRGGYATTSSHIESDKSRHSVRMLPRKMRT